MSITIYSAGGTGINIAKQIGDLDAKIHFIDTSDSNLVNRNDSDTYLVEGMDGAGKVQSVTYEHFKGQAGDVITKFKPSEQLNIVVSSLTGGSGPILAALIAKELISNGHNTVIVGVISRQSSVELKNARNALLTYKAISKQINACIPVYLVDQPSRTEADRQALNFIALMSLVADKRRTAEFDTSDLGSFLFFNKATSNDPSVSILEVTPNEELIPEKGTSIVGTILVTTRKESTVLPVFPEYLGTCVVTDKDYNHEDSRINAVLGKHANVLDSVDQQLATFADLKKINKVREVAVADSNEDGIVLG